MNINQILNIIIAILFTLLIFKYVYKNSRFINNFTSTDDIVGDEESNKNLKLLMDSIVDLKNIDKMSSEELNKMSSDELTEKLNNLTVDNYTINIPVDNITLGDTTGGDFRINNDYYQYYPKNSVVPFFTDYGGEYTDLFTSNNKKLLELLPHGFAPCDGKCYKFDNNKVICCDEQDEYSFKTPDLAYRFIVAPNYEQKVENDIFDRIITKVNDVEDGEVDLNEINLKNDIISSIVNKINEENLPDHNHKLSENIINADTFIRSSLTKKDEHKHVSGFYAQASADGKDYEVIGSMTTDSPFGSKRFKNVLNPKSAPHYFNNMNDFTNMLYIIKII